MTKLVKNSYLLKEALLLIATTSIKRSNFELQ